MTEQEIAELRTAKVEWADELLASYKRPKRKVREVLKNEDPRLKAYVKEVAQHPERHNIYEIAGIVHWMEMICKYDWNYKELRKYVNYYENWCQQTAEHGPTLFKMTPFQYYAHSIMFALEVPEHTEPVLISGKKTKMQVPASRLIREMLITMGRKNNKTGMVACRSTYEIQAGPKDAQVYIASNSGEQAKICYDECRNIMGGIYPKLLEARDKEKKLNMTEIIFNRRKEGRHSYIKVLTNSPSRMDGKKASLGVYDEWSQAEDTESKRGDAMKNVIDTSMATRENPLGIVITTASDKLLGPYHYYYLPSAMAKLLRKEEWNDRFFPIVLMAEPWLEDFDPGSEREWMKAAPMYGLSVKPQFYRDQWAKAQSNESLMVDFMTKLLNVPYTATKEVWLPGDLIERGAIAFDPLNCDELRGYTLDCKGAGDFSVKGDFTAVSFAVYISELKETRCHTKYFMPDGIHVWKERREVAVDMGYSIYKEIDSEWVMCESEPYDGKIHSRHECRNLYQRWVDEGHLTLCHGETIDNQQVAEYILDCFDSMRCVSAFGYDEYKSLDIINRVAAMQGGSQCLYPYPQTYAHFTAPVMSLNTAVRTGHFRFDTNPINAYCAQNATLDQSPDGVNYKIIKIDPAKRIDGMVTALMCEGMFGQVGHKIRQNTFND